MIVARHTEVEEMVTVIERDAHLQVTKLTGPIDLAFIDADKGGYVDYLGKLLPRIRPRGLLLAHNVYMVPDYVKARNHQTGHGNHPFS